MTFTFSTRLEIAAAVSRPPPKNGKNSNFTNSLTCSITRPLPPPRSTRSALCYVPSRTLALLRSERRFVNEVVTKLISAPSKFTAASLVSPSVVLPPYPILSFSPSFLQCPRLRPDYYALRFELTAAKKKLAMAPMSVAVRSSIIISGLLD